MITYISGGHRDVGVLSRIPVVKRIFSLDGLGVSGIKFNFITPKKHSCASCVKIHLCAVDLITFYMYIGALQVPTMMMMMMMCHGCVLLQVKTLCRTCLS